MSGDDARGDRGQARRDALFLHVSAHRVLHADGEAAAGRAWARASKSAPRIAFGSNLLAPKDLIKTAAGYITGGNSMGAS
jgi:hypothetical protein